MKASPLVNALAYPPEASEAMKVLNFDGKGWQDIHAEIQAGYSVPSDIVELKHASSVLAAIQCGDEVAMLRAYSAMVKAVCVNEFNESEALVNEGRLIIRKSASAVKRGFMYKNKTSEGHTAPLIQMCKKLKGTANEKFYALPEAVKIPPIAEIFINGDDSLTIEFDNEKKPINMTLGSFKNWVTRNLK